MHKRAIIVGNNYSAANAFYHLQKAQVKSRYPFEIVFLSDRSGYFFNGLLTQLVCDNVYLNDIGQEFRNIGYAGPDVAFYETEILGIDFEKNLVKTQIKNFNYDALLLSLDKNLLETNIISKSENLFYFNTPNDVIKIKNHIKNQLTRATVEEDIELKKSLLTFTIIGANKKGIEVACLIADYVDELIKKQFTSLNKGFIKVNLVDKNKTLLLQGDQTYKNCIFSSLNTKLIKLFLNTNVESVVGDRIITWENSEIISSTVIYCGSCTKSSLLEKLKIKKHESIIATDLYHRVCEKENIFAIGETAKCMDLGEYPKDNVIFYDYQAKVGIRNLVSFINNNELTSMHLESTTDYLTVGKYSSVVKFKNNYYTGLFAWLLCKLIFFKSYLGLNKKISALFGLLGALCGLNDGENFGGSNFYQVLKKENEEKEKEKTWQAVKQT